MLHLMNLSRTGLLESKDPSVWNVITEVLGYNLVSRSASLTQTIVSIFILLIILHLGTKVKNDVSVMFYEQDSTKPTK